MIFRISTSTPSTWDRTMKWISTLVPIMTTGWFPPLIRVWKFETRFCNESSLNVSLFSTQISSHFSAIAKLLGSNRYTTQHGWKELSEVVKRKKVCTEQARFQQLFKSQISLVLTMVQMLCSFVAPGYGDELADSISGKVLSLE